MLTAIIAFLAVNWGEIIAFLFAVHAAAVYVVNATPTDIDNKALAVFHKVIVFLADFIPNTKTGKVPGQ